MGLILVDTTVLIDNLRDEPRSEVALKAAAERGDHLCGGGFARRFQGIPQGVGLPDLLVGATAQHLGAELWTRNPRRFPMFPDLRAPY